MTQLSLDIIKSKFEHKDYFFRSQFIKEYDFKDNYRDYYQAFIAAFNYNTIQHNYASDLIDLATDLSLFDDVIYKKYLVLLNQHQHLVVKLSLIEYLCERQKTIVNATLEHNFLLLLNTNKSIILKNQLLISLFLLTNKEIYFNLLLQSISKTSDWRSIHRLLNADENFEIKKEYQQALLEVIEQIHTKKDFGRGVSQLLSERKIEIIK